MSGRQLVGTLLVACAFAAGCGVQAGDDADAAACAEVEAFLAIKDDTTAIDREMLDLRPTTVTIESVKALVPRYGSLSPSRAIPRGGGSFRSTATSRYSRRAWDGACSTSASFPPRSSSAWP
ncbi:MAG: hypothetical protein ACRELC_07415 [Gemmatimonadota bacterium]